MGRKVFISILGVGFYEQCKYQKGEFLSDEVRFVQEAILQAIDAPHWTKEDVGLIMLTDKARKENWNKEITQRCKFPGGPCYAYETLEARLERMNLPIRIETPRIPDGKCEAEMWKIFKTMFDLIHEEDQLYFDLTHSFRYLPMLLLVFGNYVKFLKKSKVVHLSYGNYEARDIATNIAPIIDLLPISALQDWTFASANYLENGNVGKLVELCNNELNLILRNESTRTEDAILLKKFVSSLDKVIDERINCRGISIVKSVNLKYLKQTSGKLSNTFIDPLNPVFERIKDSLADFDENENVHNGFAAVKWCLNFGLYQQATTILNENIITFICCKHGLNWKVESERLLVNTAFKVKLEPIDEKLWKVSNNENIDSSQRQKLIEKVKDIMQANEVEKLYKLFVSLANLRNDFNHAGMRNNPMSADGLKKALIDRFEKVLEIISTHNFEIRKNNEKAEHYFLNLSNHPSSTWSEHQLKVANDQYGEVLDIPFPEIEPEWDTHQVAELAEVYLEKIMTVARGKHAEPVVHLMGEYVFCFKLVTLLKANDIKVLVSTSSRQSVMNVDGTKTITFSFVKFREY